MPGKNGGGGFYEIAAVKEDDDWISLLQPFLEDVDVVEILLGVVSEIWGENVEIEAVFAVDLGQIRGESRQEKPVVDLSARVPVPRSVKFCGRGRRRRRQKIVIESHQVLLDQCEGRVRRKKIAIEMRQALTDQCKGEGKECYRDASSSVRSMRGGGRGKML